MKQALAMLDNQNSEEEIQGVFAAVRKQRQDLIEGQCQQIQLQHHQLQQIIRDRKQSCPYQAIESSNTKQSKKKEVRQQGQDKEIGNEKKQDQKNQNERIDANEV